MNIQSHNHELIQKYIYAELDADCESALPGGSIYGSAMLSLKDTSKSHRVQIHGFSAFLLLRSQSSKVPSKNDNHEVLIFEEKVNRMENGKKKFEVDSQIPENVLSSLDIDGHDFGEFKNELFIKGVITGSYLTKKPKSKHVKPATLEVGHKMNNHLNNSRANLNNNNIETPKAYQPPQGRIGESKPRSDTIEIEEKNIKKDDENDGGDEAKAEGLESSEAAGTGGMEDKPQRVNPDEEGMEVINLSEAATYGESRESELYEEKFFVYVVTQEIEIDNDTDGYKVYLERPIARAFSTKAGGFCCKSSIKVQMNGIILNPNIKSFSDEIKMNLLVTLGAKPAALTQIVVIAAYGVVPKDDPRPDLIVWKALNTHRYYPDKGLGEDEFMCESNYELMQEAQNDVKNTVHHSHFVSNTRRVPNTKTKFYFPAPSNNKKAYELWTKIKIMRKNGLGTFYSENKMFKTVYCVKVIPVIKGSQDNGGDGSAGRVGNNLTIPFSVKARREPSEHDKRVLNLMYQGNDFEDFVPKQKLGEMKTSMVQPNIAIGARKTKYNKVGVNNRQPSQQSHRSQIEMAPPKKSKSGIHKVDLDD